ncbi:hypothetical protein BH09BAC2_BH09BAC2_11080 [soil metagenome]
MYTFCKLVEYSYVCVQNILYPLKTEQILELYLLKKKILNLQGLGSFILGADVHVPEGDSLNVVLPANSVTFEANTKTKEDNELIDFIVLHSKKIKPLASADLDSYIALGKQFLNIGKPFIISGIGTLEKTQAGIEFKPGAFISPKIEAPKALKENENEEKSGLFQDSQRTAPPNYDRRILTIIGIIILLSIAGWFAYKYFQDTGENNKESVSSTISDTIVPIDTTSVQKDSLMYAQAQADESTKGFNVVIKSDITRQSAEKRIQQLKTYGRNVIMYTKDSVYYTVAETFTLPLADTLYVKDSLQRFYGKNIRIEMH